jgi:hypothetical protein
MVGSFVFGQLAHQVRTRKRGWLILTTFIQGLFLLVVALVAWSGDEPRKRTGPRALTIVGLLSFAQAGQVSLAIGVGLAELNTTMITGAVVSNFPTAFLQSSSCVLIDTLRSPPSETHASSAGRTIPEIAGFSLSSPTWQAVSPAAHSIPTTWSGRSSSRLQ